MKVVAASVLFGAMTLVTIARGSEGAPTTSVTDQTASPMAGYKPLYDGEVLELWPGGPPGQSPQDGPDLIRNILLLQRIWCMTGTCIF